MLPLALRALINPQDLLVFITMRLLYRKACRALHAFHHLLWKRVGILDEPNVYEESVLGFVEPKLGTLTSLLGATYLINVVISLLVGASLPSGVLVDVDGDVSVGPPLCVPLLLGWHASPKQTNTTWTYLPEPTHHHHHRRHRVARAGGQRQAAGLAALHSLRGLLPQRGKKAVPPRLGPEPAGGQAAVLHHRPLLLRRPLDPRHLLVHRVHLRLPQGAPLLHAGLRRHRRSRLWSRLQGRRLQLLWR